MLDASISDLVSEDLRQSIAQKSQENVIQHTKSDAAVTMLQTTSACRPIIA